VLPRHGGADLLVLGEDGDRQVGPDACKTAPESQRPFRALRLRHRSSPPPDLPFPRSGTISQQA
jgi:hypothetical protein